MVTLCCVPLCPSSTASKNVSMHGFTRNKKLQKIWVHKIKRDTRKSKRNPCPLRITSSTKICALHFTKGDFKIGSERKRLKPEAVPSIFPWSPTTEMPIEKQLIMPSTVGQSPHIVNSDNPDYVSNEKTNCVENGAKEESQSTIEAGNDLFEHLPCTSQSTVLNDKMPRDSTNLDHMRKLYVDSVLENAQLKQELALMRQNCKCEIPKQDKDMQTLMYTTVEKVAKQLFSLQQYELNDEDIAYYTGFFSYSVLKISLDMLFDYNDSGRVKMCARVTHGIDRKLSREDQYFLVLMKLRHNFGYKHLGHLFGICCKTVGNIVVSWINYMYVRFGSLDIWPHRDILMAHFPSSVQTNYPKVIGSMDATEFFIQTPSSLLRQSQTYSNYKHHNTLKALVVADCNGAILFMSELFTGSISDNRLVEESGFANLVRKKVETGDVFAGDILLADKGFTIQELLKPVQLNIPVFRFGNMQFTPEEVNQTRTIAHERVHIERAIGRVKSYKILTQTIPISFLGTFNQVWTVCCYLANFKMPLRTNDNAT